MGMTTTKAAATTPARIDEHPRYATGGALLDAIAARDLAAIATTLAPDATMQALVPRGLREFTGPGQVCAAFDGWFGDLAEFHVVAAVLGGLGELLHLEWRIRVRGARLGAGWFVVEQQVYAQTATDGRITALRLLCSGFRPAPDA
jgi:hypothetical protein